LKPWKSQCWIIPPHQSSGFVAAMERVLDVYKRPYDPLYPVVCMDESPRQLISESRTPVPGKPGRQKRYDYEYIRKGVYNVFLACEALQGKRFITITERKTKQDWARFVRWLSETHYPNAKRITLVMDNLNSHTPAALYETFDPEYAKAIWDRFEFVYTPKHGSWLNIAEIELNVLSRQCLNRRMDDVNVVKSEVGAWEQYRNSRESKVDWRFTTGDARIKLKKLYPNV